MNILKYEKKYANIWDEFVNNSMFGTIYHLRCFIEYHPYERFEDNSILIYENSVLICNLTN